MRHYFNSTKLLPQSERTICYSMELNIGVAIGMTYGCLHFTLFLMKVVSNMLSNIRSDSMRRSIALIFCLLPFIAIGCVFLFHKEVIRELNDLDKGIVLYYVRGGDMFFRKSEKFCWSSVKSQWHYLCFTKSLSLAELNFFLKKKGFNLVW